MGRTMTEMTRRRTRARLVGRDEELSGLVDAVLSDGADRPVILVTGEAGIGKTRLLSELVASLGSDDSEAGHGQPRVARGSCLRLADGELPFAPILEILDAIRGWGFDIPATLFDRLAGAGAGDGAEGLKSADARAVRFMEITAVLLAVAERSPLVGVIDDLHWADQSTLDLVLFLARRLRGSRVTLVLAYRSDELHRRHPLRPVIAELSRGYVRERIELAPLDPAAVMELIAGLGDVTAVGPSEIVARAEGNPFYVEELVALDPGGRGLPPSLRDVLLARVAATDEPTGHVLAACAVIGREADRELIDAVTMLDPPVLDSALRTAVDRSILVADQDGRSYRFRHALLEEAVHDDLLPGDRIELHRRTASALQARPAAQPGALARHLDLGGRPQEAIDAYLEAASRAFRALAWTEAVAAHERAAELVATAATEPNEASVARLRELVIPAALAMSWSGSPARAIAVLREWAPQAEGRGDITAAVEMLNTLDQLLNEVGDEPASRETGRRAFELFQEAGLEDEASPLGIDLLVNAAAGEWIEGRNRDALELAERALAAAEQLGSPARLFRALLERGAARLTGGNLDAGLEDVERARDLQRSHGWLDTFGHLSTNIPAALIEVGLLPLALELSEEGVRRSRELGIERSWEPWTLPGVAMHALMTGRWADADAPIAASREYRPGGLASHYLEFVAGQLAAGRGELAGCDAALAAMEQVGAGLVGEYEAVRGIVRAARADAAGDPSRRLVEAEAALRTLEGTDGLVLRSRLAADAASAAADLVASLSPRHDAGRITDARGRGRAAADLAVAVDSGRLVPGSSSVPTTRANAALASAEAARAEGNDEPSAWPPIADAYRAIGMLPRVAYVLFRGAAAALAAGDRPAGEARLRAAADLAASIGMTVLAGRVDALARAARVDLRPGGVAERNTAPSLEPASLDPWGLSAREREVLALLAEGRTNGEIGKNLFISTKTASVHVTHILDKLGVSSRTEAALIASRAGLIEGRLQPTE